MATGGRGGPNLLGKKPLHQGSHQVLLSPHETHWGGVFSSYELQSSNEDSNLRTKIRIRRLYLLQSQFT